MNPFAPRTYGTLERVTERVYLFRNVVNSAVVLGEAAVAVIDTQVNATMAARLLQHIRTLSPQPLRYVINTHYHWDHTAGNAVFQQAGATIVSSARTREFMQTRAARQHAFLASRGFELGPLPILADETVCTSGALDLGNQRLLLQCLGAAETEDALAVHVPQEGCVLSGDTVMTGSFPVFGQPVMNEGLMGTDTWLNTLDQLAGLRPVHILPGHGPVAHDADLAFLKRLMRYFLDEVALRVAQHMPLPVLLADLEAHLPAWITAMPVVWGTPRYAILRVYRGLVEDGTGEPGWQHYKPSAIPAGEAGQVEMACATLMTLQEFRQVAEEFEAGGDPGNAIAVARQATHVFSAVPAAWVFLSDCLIRGAQGVVSVLEKGDFFVEARQALQRALQLDPHDAAAHLALGRFLVMLAYRNGGDPRAGMTHLGQVIEQGLVPARGPQAALLAQAYFYTGMGHRTMGEEGQAMAHFKTALEHLPTFQPARLAQQV